MVTIIMSFLLQGPLYDKPDTECVKWRYIDFTNFKVVCVEWKDNRKKNVRKNVK